MTIIAFGRTLPDDVDAGTSDPASAERVSGRFVLGVAASALLAAINAFVGLGANSVARDEGFSISTSLRSWSSLARLSIHTETNSWLYAFALRAWSAWGRSPAMLRAPSAIAFVVTVALSGLVARRLFGEGVGILTAALVAVNGSLLMFAQQIRGYSMAVAAATAATLAFIAEVRRPRRWTLVIWCALVVLVAQLHMDAALVVTAHAVALFGLHPSQRRLRRRLVAIGVALVAVAPLPVIISGHEEGQSLFNLRPGVFRDVLYTFAGRGGVAGIIAVAVALLALLWTTRQSLVAGAGWRSFSLLLVVVLAGLPPLELLVASVVIQPTLIGRYLLPCIPAVCIGVAVVVRALVASGSRPIMRWLAAIAIVAGAARGSVSWHVHSGTEPWNAVSAYVFDHAEPTDRLVLASDSIRLFFEYERSRRSPVPAGPRPAYPASPWGQFQTGDQTYKSPSAAELAAIADSSTRLWVVIGHKHADAAVMPARLAALSPRFRIVDRQVFPGSIEVLLYERVP
jgi:mannosyltransferase